MKKNDKIYSWVIYKIENPNGRIYIGLTMDIKRRLVHYKSYGAKRQPLLCRSFEKHGFDNHIISEIDSFESDIKSAHSKEIFWIRSYMSYIKFFPENNGMNLTYGGDGSLGVQNKGRHRPDAKGKKRAAYIGESISVAKKRPIIQYSITGEYIKEFCSRKVASEELGITESSITLLLQNRIKNPRQWIFKLKSQAFGTNDIEVVKYCRPHKEKLPKPPRKPSSMKGKFGEEHAAYGKGNLLRPRQRVKCDTLDIVFKSAGEAARKLGYNQPSLSKVCRTGKNTLHGMSFRYI